MRELALRLEMGGVPFKPRAFEKAALAVEALERPLSPIDPAADSEGIDELPGVGKGIARRIHELLRSGRIAELEELRLRIPADVLGLAAVEGLGAKGIGLLYEALGVGDVRGLAEACREKRVRNVPGFGAKSEANLLRGIVLLTTVLPTKTAGRQLLGDLLPLARALEARLRALPGVDRAVIAGSVRRRRETIGDLDFVVDARNPEEIGRAFASMPEVEHVYGRGDTKTLVRLASGIDADLRVVDAESFGAALVYFTGSVAHNLALRRLAQRRRLKLNEYGLFRGERRLAGRSEEDIYRALGFEWIPPELREDAGELKAASEGTLPALIEYGALRGDLHIQTGWSDGSASIEEMAIAARELGLEYIAITDQLRNFRIAQAEDERRLMEQAKAILKLNRKLHGFRVLTGAEVDIRRDGNLDIADGALAQLEVVGAALHSHFRQGRVEMTRRLIRAMENPHVDVLFRPTARSIGRREAIDLDIDAVIAAAVRTGTVLEIDARPDRLDLRDEYVRKAVDAGALLAIDSDAHDPSHLKYADELGVAVARRGWAGKADVVNALPVEQCLARLKDQRSR